MSVDQQLTPEQQQAADEFNMKMAAERAAHGLGMNEAQVAAAGADVVADTAAHVEGAKQQLPEKAEPQEDLSGSTVTHEGAEISETSGILEPRVTKRQMNVGTFGRSDMKAGSDGLIREEPRDAETVSTTSQSGTAEGRLGAARKEIDFDSPRKIRTSRVSTIRPRGEAGEPVRAEFSETRKGNEQSDVSRYGSVEQGPDGPTYYVSQESTDPVTGNVKRKKSWISTPETRQSQNLGLQRDAQVAERIVGRMKARTKEETTPTKADVK